MKKIIPVILLMAALAACTNSADTVKTKDSVNSHSNSNGETNRDTSSYDRMSNKISDSTQQ